MLDLLVCFECLRSYRFPPMKRVCKRKQFRELRVGCGMEPRKLETPLAKLEPGFKAEATDEGLREGA